MEEEEEEEHVMYLKYMDNFVATPLRLFLKEEGNRLSPSGFPRGPAYVNLITPLLPRLQPYLLTHPSHFRSVL